MTEFAQLLAAALRVPVEKFDPGQLRDESGKWTSNGSAGSGETLEVDGYSNLYDSQKALHQTLTSEEKGALFFWSGPGFYSYNALLREGEEKYKEGFSDSKEAEVQLKALIRRIDFLDRLIAKSQTPIEVELYRGVDFPLKVGSEISDKGIAAFSGDKGWSEKFGDFVIRVKFPVGSHLFAMPDSESFDNGKEKEVLTPRNFGYRVTGKQIIGGKTYYDAVPR